MIPTLLIAGAIEITSANLYTGDRYVPSRWNEIEIAVVSSISGEAEFIVAIDAVTFEYRASLLSGIENRISIPVFFCGDSGKCSIRCSQVGAGLTYLEKSFTAAAALKLCKNSQHSHEDAAIVARNSEPCFSTTFESFQSSEFEKPGLRILQDIGYLPIFSGNLRKIINESLASENENVPREAAFLLVLALLGIVCLAFSIDRKRAALAFIPLCFLGLIAPFVIQDREDARIVEDISIIESSDAAVGMRFLSILAKPGKELTLKCEQLVKPVVTRDNELAAIGLKYRFGAPALMTFKCPPGGQCAFAGISFQPIDFDSGRSTDTQGIVPRFFADVHPERIRGTEENETIDGIHLKRVKFKYRYGVKR